MSKIITTDSIFKLHAPYPPAGDQPVASDLLIKSINQHNRHQTLLGVTGSGKTYTMALIIAALGRPTLVLSHNKTLAAQLTSEFREFFPENAVEYFVSYYDYYQPEAYIPQTDTYIEKDSSINDEIDRLRHSATQAVLERRDTIVVASISCIYGLGSPEEYKKTILVFKKGESIQREKILERLVEMRFERTRSILSRGQFRLVGDNLEIYPADEEKIVKVSFFDEEVEKIQVLDAVTGKLVQSPDRYVIYPAVHFVTSWDTLERACRDIEKELEERLEYFRSHEKLLEAQRLEQRTRYDLELLREIGYVNGIENYSRHLSGRPAGSPPSTLVDYFPDDFLVFIDESHVTIPQLHGMREGDRSRKRNLIEHGFRLPSAYDNRPLSFDEFMERVGQVVYVSATPGPYELENSSVVAEQIIRPTGLVDPEVIIRPVRNQVDDLVGEIKKRASKNEKVLVTTLTKKMAEDLAGYLADLGIRVRYLHSEIDTLDRIEILRGLRLGEFDCLVGINLLREGLDLPEVSLVGILDADQEGFLRSETSLIQTMGRAARHISGTVILYADNVTGSIKRAVDETQRRRKIQIDYNKKHGITPESIRKSVRDILEGIRTKTRTEIARIKDKETLEIATVYKLMRDFEKAMKEAAGNLEFEKAAALRDEMFELKKELYRRREETPLLYEMEMGSMKLPGRKKRR
ncbi:MAG: excinuclease ABC subunit UvrB [Candidatus Eremiobacteraeota bacterium]|nr:excinuclease ABC subunit UvrB [Candidatus Eremiobacteraeota bacterium]